MMAVLVKAFITPIEREGYYSFEPEYRRGDGQD